MNSRRSPSRALFYRTFYRLPHPLRRRLVRLAVPKYIVGAVTLLRDSEAEAPGRILLLRQPPGRGWSLPAGLLQRGEAPVVGAARELHEESGVRLPPSALRPAVPNAIVHAKGWVDVVFEASVPASGTTLSVDGAEVFEARWHSLDALPRLTQATARLLAHYGIGPLATPTDAGPAGSPPDVTGQGSAQQEATRQDATRQEATRQDATQPAGAPPAGTRPADAPPAGTGPAGDRAAGPETVEPVPAAGSGDPRSDPQDSR